MEIRELEIKFEQCVNFKRMDMEGLHHVKSLPYLSVVQSVEGSYDIQIGDGPLYQTGDGGFFVAASQVTQNILHHSNPETHRMHNRWIFLDVVVNRKYRLDMVYRFPTVLPPAEAEEMKKLFDELFSAPDDICRRLSLHYRIIGVLLRAATPIEYSDKDDPLFGVIKYIEKHYRQKISVGELAKSVHLSESGFYLAFQRVFQTSPIAYLNHYRLTLASYLLRETDKTIAQISEEVGFSDQLYFSKMFRRVFLVSPRAYRKSRV